LNTVKNEWVNQTFLGQVCTFGDDRHLTTCMLGLNKTIRYQHNAVCYTETPNNWARWFSQQTRWAKSAHRETLLLMSNVFHKRLLNLWFIFDTMFTFYYGFFLAFLSLVLIYRTASDHNGNENNGVALMGGLIFAMAMFRSLFAVLIDCDWRHFYFGMYGYVYYLFLLPIKLWAVVTAFNNKWGTSPRYQIIINFIDTIPVIAWWFVIFGGIIWHYLRNQDVSSNGWEILAAVGLVFILYFIFVIGAYSTLYTRIRTILDHATTTLSRNVQRTSGEEIEIKTG